MILLLIKEIEEDEYAIANAKISSQWTEEVMKEFWKGVVDQHVQWRQSRHC